MRRFTHLNSRPVPYGRMLLSVAFLFLCISGFSQTPGLIVRDGNGNIPPQTWSSVLDPNHDGFTSKTTAGFNGSDLDAANSEIPYITIPVPFTEPTGDLRRGPDGRFSELVKDQNGNGFYTYSDGTNFMARLRVGSIMAGSKGYSVLIDKDSKFGASGPNADPNYKYGNPGFEYEVVYESNFRVAVYNVDGATTGTLVAAYDLASNPQYAQTSVALTRDGGNADYFYDFYVPLSALGITASTPIRVTATTVMSPMGAIGGPSSDAYGNDDLFSSIYDQWTTDILAQKPFTLTDGPVSTFCTAAPTVDSPISASSTSISGTWTKASYSTETTA
ncbi:MAG: hypothetical protein Q8909_20245, partial [Bacteroidota bacterium]|nr:hypothetical protein [Bacteroidota bacterium]